MGLCLLFFSSFLHAMYRLTPEMEQEIVYYQNRYDAQPTSNNACFNLAMVYAYTGDIEAGFDKLKQLTSDYADVVLDECLVEIQKDPNQWRVYFRQAFGYYFKKDYESTIQSFKQVLSLKPDQIWAMAFIAYVHGEQGELSEALDWTNKALALEPDSAALHFLMGEVLRRKKRYFASVSHFVKCAHFRSKEKKYRMELK